MLHSSLNSHYHTYTTPPHPSPHPHHHTLPHTRRSDHGQLIDLDDDDEDTGDPPPWSPPVWPPPSWSPIAVPAIPAPSEVGSPYENVLIPTIVHPEMSVEGTTPHPFLLVLFTLMSFLLTLMSLPRPLTPRSGLTFTSTITHSTVHLHICCHLPPPSRPDTQPHTTPCPTCDAYAASTFLGTTRPSCDIRSGESVCAPCCSSYCVSSYFFHCRLRRRHQTVVWGLLSLAQISDRLASL